MTRRLYNADSMPGKSHLDGLTLLFVKATIMLHFFRGCQFLLLALFSTTSSFGEQPNIVFVFTDDLGWGDLGVFYQNESQHDKKHRTPELDRLAQSGLQMRAHYCPAPVCAPSRSSLLTGVHQGNAVVRNNQFDKALEDNHTLGSVLKEAGYRTCMIGKYGLQGRTKKGDRGSGSPDVWPAYPTKRGFDEFFGYVSHYAGHFHYPNDPWAKANKSHRGVPDLWHSDEAGDFEISESLSKCYTTDLFTARAKYFLKEHAEKRENQPFFLMLNYDTPHAALQVPTGAYPAGKGVDGGVQWTGGTLTGTIAQPAINTATGEVDSFIHPEYADQNWSDVEKRFATMVRRIDSAVGDLNATLEELGLADNTLVVFTSDNGPHHEAYLAGEKWGSASYTPQAFQSYGPYDGTKRDCWEGGIRMPTLAWWKGKIAANRIDHTPSQFHDWMTTFCEIAGVPAPARCDGVSLLPTLSGAGKQSQSTVYIEYENNGRTPAYDDFLPSRRKTTRKEMQVIRMEHENGTSYKGVRYNIQSADDDFEIYDVESDPNEENNLAESSIGRELQEKMKAKVLQIRRPNSSAKRTYDNAETPALEESLTCQVQRYSLPETVSYVPQAAGPGENVSESVTADDDQTTFAFTAKTAGIYVIQGSFSVDRAGEHTIELSSDASCFMRFHESHAIDLPESGGGSDSTKRTLAKGNHPFKLTIRVEKPNAKTSWSME